MEARETRIGINRAPPELTGLKGPESGPQRSESFVLQFFRPIDALETLGVGLDQQSPKYLKLKQELESLPGFLRISENEMRNFAGRFEHVVNITGYSGQGVHKSQRQLLEVALLEIMHDKGWDRSKTLLVSGGTALGTPDAAIRFLSGKQGYTSLAIMALPGLRYPLSPGYSCVCIDDEWLEWGAEVDAMSEVSTATIVAGGGSQALEDALCSLEQEENVAVVINAYNNLARIEIQLDGKQSDVIIPTQELKSEGAAPLNIALIQTAVRKKLSEQGITDETLDTLRIQSLAISGLVTESRKGERRACAQDLMYFAITGNYELLPEAHRPASLSAAQKLQNKIMEKLDLYYLLDDPYEGVAQSAVFKLNDVLHTSFSGMLDQIIDHAVRHDIYDPKSGCFGPSALGAGNPEELARILKASLQTKLAA